MVEYRPEDLDLVYGALSNPVRRELVDQIASSAVRVTDLEVSSAISLAGISKHVRVLEDAGLVHREIRGRENLIGLEPAPLAGAAAWLSGYRRFWEQRLDLLDRRIRESRRH